MAKYFFEKIENDKISQIIFLQNLAVKQNKFDKEHLQINEKGKNILFTRVGFWSIYLRENDYKKYKLIILKIFYNFFIMSFLVITQSYVISRIS